MPTTAQVIAWAEAYRQAWENADTPAAVALFAEDSSYRSNIFEEPYLGWQGVEEYWSTVTAVQSDVKVWMGQPVIEGDRVIVEFWTRMLGGGEPLTLVGNLLMHRSARVLAVAARAPRPLARLGRVAPQQDSGRACRPPVVG